MTGLSRRAFVLAGASVALGACGGSKARSGAPSSGAGASSGPSGGDATRILPADQYQLVQFFKSGSPPAGVAHRLPFGLGSVDGVLQAGGPQQMEARILDADGKEVAARQTVTRHARQLQRPYWPLPINLAAGTYQAAFTFDGAPVGSPAFFDVGTATKLPKTGDRLPARTTPTTDRTEGVTPICTRTPACPMHDTSLDAVLGRTPVALLVATPAYCQTAICGPVLDVILDNRVDGITYIHAEVWKDDTFAEHAPIVDAYSIDYEPVLFVVRADGAIADRLDVIWDADEVVQSLRKAL